MYMTQVLDAATEEQLEAIDILIQAQPEEQTREAFLEDRAATYDAMFGTIFLRMYGMLVGIEKDGYTHS